MRPEAVKRVLVDCIKHKRNLLLRGQPGCGKTDLVHAAAEEAGADCITIITSLRDPTDANGYPVKVDHPDLGTVMTFVPTYELAKMITADKPLVVFFDELEKGSPATQASFCNLFQSRKQNGYTVSDHVVFFAAINRKSDRAGSNATSTALLNRFAIIDVDIYFPDWLAWASQAGLPSELLAFISARPEWLERFDPNNYEQPQPTPRSWAAVGRFLLDQAGSAAPLPGPVQQEVIAGYVGVEAARDFFNAKDIASLLPDVDSVFHSPDTARLPAEPIAKHAITTVLSKRLNANSEEEIKAACTYIKRLGNEFWRVFQTMVNARPDAAAIVGSVAYIQETSRG